MEIKHRLSDAARLDFERVIGIRVINSTERAEVCKARGHVIFALNQWVISSDNWPAYRPMNIIIIDEWSLINVSAIR